MTLSSPNELSFLNSNIKGQKGGKRAAKNNLVSNVFIWKTMVHCGPTTSTETLESARCDLLISELTISTSTTLIQATSTPHLGQCNSLWTVPALFPRAPHTSYYCLHKTLQGHPNTHQMKSRPLTIAYVALCVPASAFSTLLSNCPLNHSTLGTLGIPAMSWTQASCTCHSLFAPPAFIWPILSLQTSV